MRCFIKIACCFAISVFVCLDNEELNAQGAQGGHQDRNALAALPSKSDLGTQGETASENRRISSFYRQSATARATQAQTQTYPYPASKPPARSYSARLTGGVQANGQFDNRLTAGATTTTGNLRRQTREDLNQADGQAQQSNQRVAQASALSGNSRTKAARQPGERYASAQPTWGQRPTSVFRQAAYQAPNYRTAQNCTCAPGYAPVAGYPPQGFVPANQTPTLNPAVGGNLGAPPANLQLPPTGYAQPGYGQAVCGQPAGGQVPYQQIGTPQFGAQGARWWTPFLSGSGVYTPLLKIVPTKVGTYLGQGIIGQPTAYVDGEPLRNLLRYIAP